MSGYRRWVASSQGTWVTSMIFVALALLNVATGVWWLAALMALAGIVNLRRAFGRRQGERARL